MHKSLRTFGEKILEMGNLIGAGTFIGIFFDKISNGFTLPILLITGFFITFMLYIIGFSLVLYADME